MVKRPKIRIKVITAVGLVVAAASLAVLPAFGDFSGEAWRFYQPIQLSSDLPEESLVEVALDREVFAHARRDLADLRVVQGDDLQEVPYKLLVERGERRRSSLNVDVQDLGHVPDQFTSFVVEVGQEGVLHNELEIRTPSENFQRTVVVEASPDRQSWAIVQEEGQIFDFTIRERNVNERDTRVRYPSSTARYLRIRIINDLEPLLEVTGAVAYFNQELLPREAELAAIIASREEDEEKRRTLLVLDLGTQGSPTSRLVITTTQESFYRQVTLDGSTDAEKWTRVLSSDTLYVYNTPKFVGSKLSLSYPESTYRYYRLTILNEDNPPLAVDSAQAYGFLRKLIFSASPDRTYQLCYGNAEARSPSYELERIFPYLVTENLPRAQLGAHAANPLFAIPPERLVPFTERYAWLLTTAVVVASLLIGMFLANLLRQVRKLLPPPSSPS